MNLGLKGVHALVTGASGGIGLEVSRLFLEQGAKVTAHYNTNQATLQPLLGEYGPERIQAIQANLVDELATQNLFAHASQTFGPVQVAVINHGIEVPKFIPTWEMTLDQWKKTLDTNLTSSFIVAKEYLKGLVGASTEVKEKAAIVLVGSTAGKFGEAGHVDYAASKSAMMYGMTLSLKNEIVKIAPKGRVNAVGPGYVVTPMAEESLKDPNIRYQVLSTTPLKKIALPHDVATQVVILSSSVASGHVTGQVLMIEGGMEGRLLNTREDVGIM